MSCRTWRGARQRSSVWGRTISSWVLVAISDRSVPRCCSPAATASPQWPAPQWPARRRSSLLSPRPRSASRSTPTPSRCSFPLPLFLPAVRLAVVRCHHAHGRAGQGCAVALRGVDAGGLEGPGAQRGGRAVDWPPNTRGTAHRCACQPLCGDLCRSCGRFCGLPADRADVGSERWRLIWRLRTRHCALGCWPMGGRAIHEGARASHAG